MQGIKIFDKLSAVLIASLIIGLVQNPVWQTEAKTGVQDEWSVTARLDSKKVNRKTVTMKKGSNKKISLTIAPKNSRVKNSKMNTSFLKTKYHSNKKSIVSVTKTGVLKAKKKGTAKITITVTGSEKSKKKVWFKVKVMNKSNSDNKTEIPVTLTVGGKTFSAKFYDNPAARELVEKMPMTLSMEELNGNEKYHYFDTNFPTNETSPKQIQAGDIKLYGSGCLVTFYKSFTTSYRYTSVGYVEDAAGFARAVGSGNVKITFQKG